MRRHIFTPNGVAWIEQPVEGVWLVFAHEGDTTPLGSVVAASNGCAYFTADARGRGNDAGTLSDAVTRVLTRTARR